MTQASTIAPNYVLLWAMAVDQQGFRALEKEDRTWSSRLSDAVLFASALRNLLRAIEYAKEQSAIPKQKKQIRAALDKFSENVPHWRRVRNALEHFDAYDQKEGYGQGQPFVIIWTNSDTGVLAVGEGIELNVQAAFDAAAELHLEFEGALQIVIP